jgi:hypothetical protein
MHNCLFSFGLSSKLNKPLQSLRRRNCFITVHITKKISYLNACKLVSTMMNKFLIVLFFSVWVQAMYQEEVGTYDWYAYVFSTIEMFFRFKQNIGEIKEASFSKSSAQSILFSITGSNVLSALNTKNGELGISI